MKACSPTRSRVGEHPAVLAMQKLAAELERLYPDQLLRGGRAASLQQPGDDRRPTAKVMGVYRKSHIPDGPGYEEKFYFRPGNTGFKVWPGAVRRRSASASAGTNGIPRPRAR